jgi:hypothetical protein
MTSFEKLIVDCFIKHFVKMETEATENPAIALISAREIYPEFDEASPAKKTAFFDAAKSLEARGLIKLKWRRGRKRLDSLACADKNTLFSLSGWLAPNKTAGAVRLAALSALRHKEAADYSGLLKFIAEETTAYDIEQGMNGRIITDFVKLIRALSENAHIAHKSSFLDSPYSVLNGITPRALSVALYNDSKRIETVIKLCARILSRAKRNGLAVPDLSFLKRSFPETLISGKIMIHFMGARTPMINATGCVIGLPLETVTKITKISVIRGGSKAGPDKVLTVENKETFYALAGSERYSCSLYTGGYPSRAVNTIVQILARSNFRFFHTGDIDPDGILILQELQKAAQKKVTPVCMDADTFRKYRKHGRKLEKTMVGNISLISDKVRAIDGMRDLLTLIERTGLGIEQEVIDYGYIRPKSMPKASSAKRR